jgi:hypothetical protein
MDNYIAKIILFLILVCFAKGFLSIIGDFFSYYTKKKCKHEVLAENIWELQKIEKTEPLSLRFICEKCGFAFFATVEKTEKGLNVNVEKGGKNDK